MKTKLLKNFDVHAALHTYEQNQAAFDSTLAAHLAAVAEIDAKFLPVLKALRKNLTKTFGCIEKWAIHARADWPSKSTTIGQATLGFRDSPPKVDLIETTKEILNKLPHEAIRVTEAINKEYILANPSRNWSLYGLKIAKDELFYIDLPTTHESNPVAQI